MTTEAKPDTVEAPVEGAQATGTPASQDAPKQEAAVNWEQEAKTAKGQLEDLGKRFSKLEGDLKAAEGRAKPVEAIRAEMADIRTEMAETMGGLTKALSIVAKAQETGQTEGLASQVESIGAQAQTKRNFQRAYDSLYQSLQTAVTDDDGTVLVDLATTPELKEVGMEWNQAVKAQNGLELALVVGKALPIINKLRKAKGEERVSKTVEAAVKKAKEETEAAAAEKLRKAGALPTEIGGAATAAGIGKANRDNIDSLYITWEREHPNQANPYEGQYRKFLNTGSL